MANQAVRTTCPYCGVGCGVLAAARDDGTIEVKGDPDHPANFGRLCVKGAALGETISLDGRLLHPMVDGRQASWDQALDRVGAAFAKAIAEHGPDSVAFYVSGQLLTEDYYVANKLMKGFIGAGNIDTNSRLCMSSSVAGHVRAFGADTVPGNYEDLEQADLVVLVGSNAAWCHPVLFQRLQAAKAARPSMKIVVIDPRRTATVDGADLHLPLKPGTDVALFNGLLAHLAEAGAVDEAFLADHATGAEEAVAAARCENDPADVCDLDADDLATFYDWFTDTQKVVTVYSQGVNQSSAGTDKVNAIINCHLLTGRIGQLGMGPLSFTGQPNAMGGREVGGLANQLAAHMSFTPESIDRVGRFWHAPQMASNPGLKAVDLFQAVHDGKIKALWIMATNPAVSLTDTGLVRAALANCDFVAVSDCMERTDTTVTAHVLLPALTWAEKDGTVTNSERRISRQRAILPPPGEAMADWWIICQVAHRLGHGNAFPYQNAAEIFREHAQLSGFENQGRRAFDISGLINADYNALEPTHWPVSSTEPPVERLYADGQFFHADRKARLWPVTYRPTAATTSPDWPLALNTGRTRDHWHTMTRTGKSPRLGSHMVEPWLAIHPADAARFELTDGGLAQVESPYGSIVLRVTVDSGQRVGDVFAPMHWNDQFAADANVGRLIAPATDPISGQPELKHTPVRVSAVAPIWEAVLLSRSEISHWASNIVWSRSAGNGFTAYRLYGLSPLKNWSEWAQTSFGDGNWLEYQDDSLGLYRAARLNEGRLELVFLAAPAGRRPNFDWLDTLFTRQKLENPERADILAGCAANRKDPGPIVCACHQVGRNTILDGITSQGLTSVEALGRSLKAGTNCGSCIPEMKRLVQQSGQSNQAAALVKRH